MTGDLLLATSGWGPGVLPVSHKAWHSAAARGVTWPCVHGAAAGTLAKVKSGSKSVSSVTEQSGSAAV